MENIRVRPAHLPHDYSAIAEVLNAEDPDGASTADELAHEDAARDPRFHHAAFVAETPGSGGLDRAGVGYISHETRAHREGKFLLNLRVRPEWQGHGVGKALYQAAIQHLDALSPQELCADVWGAHPRAGRFLADRGFMEIWRRVDQCLDTASFDFASYATLETRLRAMGIVIRTYAERKDDAQRLTKLHSLDETLWQDVPYFGQAVTSRTLGQFVSEEVGHPGYLEDASFIASHEGVYIGYSNLLESGDGFHTDMTGVLRPYRRLGVATALKLRGIRYAQTHGNQRLWTVNDSTNAAILHLNKKLGFQQAGEIIRMAKRLNQ